MNTTLPGTSPEVPGTVTSGRVTVSMPYWRTPGTVRAAVLAVLEQTRANLRLYVVNDGDHETPPWPALSGIRDPRLVRVDLPANHGRYFCDAAVLAASEDPWFAVHDADDVADPQWLEVLTAAATRHGWVAAFAPQLLVSEDELRFEPVARPFAVSARLRHLAHHAGVYRTEILRSVGGPHPDFRIGYDTLMVNMVGLAGPIGAVERALYTRNIRPGSLTTHPRTDRRSVARRTAQTRLQRLWADARTRGPATAFTATLPPLLAAEVASAANTVRTAASGRRPRPTCCDMHNQHCEPPADLCCPQCTEAAHTGLFPHADGSGCVLDGGRVS